MPHFALICTDKPEHEHVRKANREAHLTYLKSTACVLVAGPFIKDGVMTGSLLVLDLPSRQDAENWAASDPYAVAELFDTVRIEEWKRVIG